MSSITLDIFYNTNIYKIFDNFLLIKYNFIRREGWFMNNENFKYVAATELNPNYNKYIERLLPIYQSNGEIRSPFARDYTRILHCGAYRRLKHLY